MAKQATLLQPPNFPPSPLSRWINEDSKSFNKLYRLRAKTCKAHLDVVDEGDWLLEDVAVDQEGAGVLVSGLFLLLLVVDDRKQGPLDLTEAETRNST